MNPITVQLNANHKGIPYARLLDVIHAATSPERNKGDKVILTIEADLNLTCAELVSAIGAEGYFLEVQESYFVAEEGFVCFEVLANV